MDFIPLDVLFSLYITNDTSYSIHKNAWIQ